MASLTAAFRKHLSSLADLRPGDGILIAFSGGKDSVALTGLLLEVRDEAGITLAACHVNHMIRGDEADRDEAFCRAFCEERGIPFSVRRADVPAFCEKEGVGLEEGARTERYRLLREVAKERGCRFIATAHTADDQAETVLFHLARGTGFAGAAGISPVSRDLIRPLLPFTAKTLAAYLEEKKLPFITDSSNADLAYTRNRLRREVLPALEKAVPGAGAALARFAGIAFSQNALIRKAADQWEKETGNDPKSARVRFRDAVLLAADEADRPLLYEILRRMAKTKGLSVPFERFEAILSLLKSAGMGKIIEIANGFSFFREKDSLSFGKTPHPVSTVPYRHILQIGDTAIPEIGAVLTRSAPARGKVRNIHKNHLIIQAASDRIKGELCVRGLSPGDRIRMNGMSKSVKKALCDAGVSADERKRLPVICDESGVFWVPRLGLSDRARDPEASFVFTMQLRFSPNEKNKKDGLPS